MTATVQADPLCCSRNVMNEAVVRKGGFLSSPLIPSLTVTAGDFAWLEPVQPAEFVVNEKFR